MEFFSINGKYLGVCNFCKTFIINILGFGKARGKGFAYWLHG
jgi:hypothetical protein